MHAYNQVVFLPPGLYMLALGLFYEITFPFPKSTGSYWIHSRQKEYRQGRTLNMFTSCVCNLSKKEPHKQFPKLKWYKTSYQLLLICKRPRAAMEGGESTYHTHAHDKSLIANNTYLWRWHYCSHWCLNQVHAHEYPKVTSCNYIRYTGISVHALVVKSYWRVWAWTGILSVYYPQWDIVVPG